MIINNVNIDFGAMNIGMKDPKPPNGGAVWVWGLNNFGVLATGTSGDKYSSPIQTIAGGINWRQVSLGTDNSAAIKNDGTLWTWGLNNLGALGDNTNINKLSPVQTIAGGNNWSKVSAGSGFAAAIKTDGTLWAWGWNGSGQLGDNTNIVKSSPVQTIANGTNWAQISCGAFSSCAIKTDGTLWTWGASNNGQLGDNTTISKSSPVQTVASGTNWKQVANGYFVTAVKTDGTLWTWGNNAYGSLGDNTTISRSSPVQTVASGTNWNTVPLNNPLTGDTFGYVTGGIKTDGTLWLWGRNIYGTIGDNTTIAKSSPVQTIAGGTNWANVSLGPAAAAIKNDGTLWMWGANQNGSNEGRLGDNTVINRLSPVQTIAGGTDWAQVGVGTSGVIALRTIIFPG